MCHRCTGLVTAPQEIPTHRIGHYTECLDKQVSNQLWAPQCDPQVRPYQKLYPGHVESPPPGIRGIRPVELGQEGAYNGSYTEPAISIHNSDDAGDNGSAGHPRKDAGLLWGGQWCKFGVVHLLCTVNVWGDGP